MKQPTAPLFYLSCICAAIVAQGAASSGPPASVVGRWSTFPGALPNSKLGDAPVLGNGHLGVALDAHNPGGGGFGPGLASSLDAWLNTNSFWACTACDGVDPDNAVPACCSTVALGGLSLRFGSTFSSGLSFTASQFINNASLVATFSTPAGGSIVVVTTMHPTIDFVSLNVSWWPNASGGDPPFLALNASVWVVGRNNWLPSPWLAGCANGASLAPELCASNPPDAATPQLTFVVRNASTVNATVMPANAALAAGLWPGCSWRGAGVANDATAAGAFEVFHTLSVAPQSWAAVVVAEAESIGPPGGDPSPAALSTAAAALGAGAESLAAAAADWWSSFWARSSLSLPSQPAAESLWWASQYFLACMSAATSDVAKPPPGLYGPWVTMDAPSWHGDYTLDYNFNAPYFGVFSSNHGPQAESFWRVVTDWIAPAQRKAQVQASMAHVSCPPNALYYDCHIAPRGLASLDGMLRYMTWNGPFAALLFINHFEYMRNATFASSTIYPLLDGLNAWWACYLNLSSAGVYNDDNAFNPDMEHEEQPVPNPQIAMSFVARTISAQIDLAAALDIVPPPHLLDIMQNLAPFNVAVANVTIPPHTNANASFTVLIDTRCHDDIATFYSVPSVAACEADCAGNSACGAFSYCPPAGVEPSGGGCSGGDGQPAPNTCWSYASVVTCVTNATANGGWTSGYRAAPNVTTVAVPVWTALFGADAQASDWFALYPAWPSEALEPSSPWADAAMAAVARASSVLYSDFALGRPVDLFAMAVRAGSSSSAEPTAAWSPEDVLDGLNAYLAIYTTKQLLPYAPGGGVENAGITRAINEMLLQSYRVPADSDRAALGDYVLALFPFWASDEPAAFASLLAKGGFEVSASYDNATQAVLSPVVIVAAYTLNGAPSSRCTLLSPWGAAWGAGSITATCGGATVPLVNATLGVGRPAFSFDAPLGAACTISLTAAPGKTAFL